VTDAEWQELYQQMQQHRTPEEAYPPEDSPEKRERWRRYEAPEYVFTIEAIRYLQAQYPAKIPKPQLGPDGRETYDSMGKRAAAAVKMGMAQYPGGWRASPYTYAALRRRLAPVGQREERALRERVSAEKFQSTAPTFLRQMGLREREISILGDPSETRETLLVKRWTSEGKRSTFILSGVGGAGKTVALAAALQHFCRELVHRETADEWQWRPSKGHYVLAGELANGPAFGKGGEEHVERYSKYPLLCLDDLGSETLTEVSRDMLFRIFDNRHRGLRTRLTLIATNLDWTELVSRYGARFERRFSPKTDEGAAVLRVNKPFAEQAP
jgi:hypothetical protein